MADNYDYDLERQRLARRRAMLDSMTGSALQPIQTDGRGGGQWAQVLGKVMQAIMGQAGGAGVDKEEAALSDRYKQDLQSGISNYLKTSQGTPDEDMGQGYVEPGQKPDQKKAILDAIGSNHPVLQQLGMSQFQNIGKKETLSRKDLLSLSGYDAKSKIAAAMAGDESMLQPETKEHVVGNQIVAGVPGGLGGYKSVGDFREQFSPVGVLATSPDGQPIVGQTEKTTGKATFAPKGTSVTVDTGQKAGIEFGKKLAEGRAKAIETSFDKAQAANASLQSLDAASQDFAAGIKSGAPAQVALSLAKWGKAIGLDADPSVANTEAFRSNMAQQVLSSVKALGSGTGISNADRDYAEKAAGGSISLDDQTMFRLMNIQKAAAANTILNHRDLLARNANASGGDPADLATFEVPLNLQLGDTLDYDERTRRVKVKMPGAAASKPGVPSNAPIPGQAKPAAGGVLSLEAYLKSKGL